MAPRATGVAGVRELTLVSVIVPVRNGAAFVADAVESALAQRGAASEVIVVDDGSTDDTRELLARRFAGRVTIERTEGRGVSAARNRGMALAQGELLVFLDADDLLPPRYLERFAEAATAAPQAEVFHCGWRGIDFDDGHLLYWQDGPFDLDGDPFHALAAAGSPHIDSLAVRRCTAARVGGFDEAESIQADWDFWLRLAASGATFQGVPGNVAIIRRRRDSMSGSAARTQLVVEGLAVLERHLSRHERCPACVHADVGLRSWREAVLRASARDFARRHHLGGRAGRMIGATVAVARRPRLASTAWLMLRERGAAAK